VVCVPSRNEPFGIVILEAWSAGKPVVATDRGGAGEIVRHGHNGLRISPEPGIIAAGMLTLFSDFDYARRIGENGRREIAARFTWALVAEQTVDAYEMVVPRSAVAELEAVPAAAAAPSARRPSKEPSAPAPEPLGDEADAAREDALEIPAT